MTTENFDVKTTSKTTPDLVMILLLTAGVIMLLAAVLFVLTIPSKPVSVEGDSLPLGFSIGLDNPGIEKIDRQGARLFWQNAETIFSNGYASGVKILWPELERAVPDPDLTLVKIIPSAGLFPYYRSESFATEIAAFVQKGGTLLCLAQPLGSMYKALPGSPKGFGWTELGITPLNCTREVETAIHHPVHAGLTTGRFKAFSGGFFTEYPGSEQTQVLLRDSLTGQPVVIAYRYGLGLVVATTLMGDTVAHNFRTGENERKFLDQLLIWAQAGGVSMPQYNPGDQMEMNYLFTSTETTGEGFMEIHRPDGTMAIDSRSIPDGTMVEIKGPFQVDEPTGIWRIITYRGNTSGQPLGKRQSFWFAVGHTPSQEFPTGVQSEITIPGSHQVSGGAIPVTIHFWNRGFQSTEMTVKGQNIKQTVNLQPGQYKRITENIEAGTAQTVDLTYEFFDAAGAKVNSLKRTIRLIQPDRIYLSITGPKSVTPGLTRDFSLQALSITPGSIKAECHIHLVHNGKILWNEIRELTLNGAYSSSVSFKVPFPKDIKGTCILEGTLTMNGKEITGAWYDVRVE